VGTEIRKHPSFLGLNDLEEFLTKYEEEVLENQRFLALDISPKATPARWWGVQKYDGKGTIDLAQNMGEIECRSMMGKAQ
jgi:hypothetical protein